MNMPIQAKPVIHAENSATRVESGLLPSGSCGCPNVCLGACVFGSCVGGCI